ncbi:hypothetical protein SLS62_007802 [Diatrype stigma]|uniref:Uncharacterized protein n=1 Tax=Diatrype stigma TaxID=117547 RepID=A0AAN9ULE8_9PEZI
MSVSKSILLAISAAALAAASPLKNYDANSEAAHVVSRAGPVFYSGPWQNFPGADTWLSYEQLLEINRPYIAMTGSTEGDIQKIDTAVRAISASVGVPDNVLFSIIMQESHGNVGAPVTYSPENIPTGGLMQCYNNIKIVKRNSLTPDAIVTQCPGYEGQHDLTQEQINGMIQGGAEHFKGNMANWGDSGTASGPSTIYPALREYNSGNVNAEDLSDGLRATPEYVSDVAQRLGGWAD